MTTQVGNFVVFGAIEQKWLAFGGIGGSLGRPLSNEAPTFDNVGREQTFERGIIAWHPDPGVGAHVIWGLIGRRWIELGKERFGYPVTDESDFPAGGKYNVLRAMHLAGHPDLGILWKPGMPSAWEIYGAIRQFWINAGSVSSGLGYPVDEERPAFDGRGRYQTFEGGTISWHPDISGSPFAVVGLINQRWVQIGREQYGYPIANEMAYPDGGRYSLFRALQRAGQPQVGIVWKAGAISAWEIYGAILQKWVDSGSGSGPLGYPVQEERATFDGVGRSQAFEGGFITWHPDIGAHIVMGAIGQRWLRIGREQFGYPVTDEGTAADGHGRFSHFRALHLAGKPDASIYWTPETGAYEVYGAIRDRWAQRGWEQSNVGYPLGPEQPRADGPGREQPFQFGRIVWSDATGALFDPLVLNAPIVSGGLAALGGWVSVSIFVNGAVRWQGHAHDSGADGYDFEIAVAVPATTGITLVHRGSVGGTLTAGARDHDWDELTPPSDAVCDHLGEYQNSTLQTHLEYSSTLGQLASWVLKFSLGTAAGPLGGWVFIGIEVGSFLSSGSLVPGARLAEGILWMAGPANMIFAVAAAGIASAGSRTEELDQVTYDWANAQVFGGSLPPRDRLVLTDTIGGGNRPFTFPRFDGKITLNLGPAAFDDPRSYRPQPDPTKRMPAYGEILVHELVHACQIARTSNLTYLAGGLATKLCEVAGPNPYNYPAAGPAYPSMNIEQQAQIVSDWFGGFNRVINKPVTPQDTTSTFYRYVQDMRLGAF